MAIISGGPQPTSAELADCALFVGYGPTIPGREQRALTMVAMDCVLVAFEAGAAPSGRAAAHTSGANDPQKALEGAGGVQAWSALLQAAGSMPAPSSASRKPCPAFSGQP